VAALNDPRPDDTSADWLRQPPAINRAVLAVNAAWSVASWRGSARTVSERMRQLRAAGLVCDEQWFRDRGLTS
jgi:hypothetical protein